MSIKSDKKHQWGKGYKIDILRKVSKFDTFCEKLLILPLCWCCKSALAVNQQQK